MSSRRKQREKRKNTVRKFLKVCIVWIFLAIVSYMIYGMYKESRIRFVETEDNNNIELTNIVSQEITTQKVDVNIAKTYLGYTVSAGLEIPKIELKSNVLQDYTKQTLEACLCKYWGPEPNEIGNYCIAGHNYDKENMFNHLIDLEIGDKIYLSDNKNGKYAYIIYDIYKVKPKNVKPLSQNTNNKREITLITCVNYSANRLIIKAVED